MRTLFAALAFLLILAPASVIAAPSPADEAAIHGVIAAQLDAFRRDDASGAFAYASPELQAMFGNPDHFMAMVQRGYAPVYRPRSMDFTSLDEEDGAIVQRVELIGPDGLAYTARYTMEREADGSWRISGCELLQSNRVGT
jgi:hypothetical protein